MEGSSSDGLARILGQVAAAAARAGHVRGLVAAVGQVLVSELGVLGLELVLPQPGQPGQPGRWMAFAWWPGAAVLPEPVAAPAIEEGSRPKMRRVHGQWEVRVPIPIGRGGRNGGGGARPAARLSIGFPAGDIPPAALETDFILALGQLLGLACDGAGLAGRLAALSRRAHADNRALRQHLDVSVPAPVPVPVPVTGGGARSAGLSMVDRIDRAGRTDPVAVSPLTWELLRKTTEAAGHPVALLLRESADTGREVVARPVAHPITPSRPSPSDPSGLSRSPSERVPTLDTAIRNAITEALTATRGKLYGSGGAAAVLGLKPSTLQAKMVKLGIQRTAFASGPGNAGGPPQGGGEGIRAPSC